MSKLIFIYSVDSGILASLPGAVKKVFGGKSGCALCNITYGPIHEKKLWKAFRESFPKTSVFYHKDEVPKDISAFITQTSAALPVVLSEGNGSLKIFVSAEELKNCDGDERCLIEILRQRT